MISAMDADSEFQCLHLLLADFYAVMHNKEGKSSFVRRAVRLDWTDIGLIDDPRIFVRISARKIDHPTELLLGLAVAPGMRHAEYGGKHAGRQSLSAFYENIHPYEDRVEFMERALGRI